MSRVSAHAGQNSDVYLSAYSGHYGNTMQRTEGFVLERALVCIAPIHACMHMQHATTNQKFENYNLVIILVLSSSSL